MSARPWRGPIVHAGLLAALLLLTLALAGCSTTTITGSGGSAMSAPRADSPTGAVARLLWVYDHRAIDLYPGSFTSDFRFVFAAGDSAGSPFPSNPWDFTYEVVHAQHLFVGDGAEPPATEISTSVAGSVMTPGPGRLVDVPDPRPGKDPRFHRVLYVGLGATIRREIGDLQISGVEAFYVVRGDSAQVASPDPAMWYIERWEELDAFVPLSATRASAPPPTLHWGGLKALYLPLVRD